jgi:formylglycine-generating enzyme required for sulfatase activity
MGRSTNACDAYSSNKSNEQPEHGVTVVDFYLDRFEVTVGRFRHFVEQYDGTPPASGAAAHPLIAGSGWDAAWDGNLPSTQAGLISNLKCLSGYHTWTDSAVSNETYPISCVNWYVAFAFCAWDGGRLPTEAEWEYASAGGSENRLYPWGQEAPSATYANFSGTDPFLNVGSHPAGASRWGHHDLAGSMVEWVLDWYDPSWYSVGGSSCANCANVNPSSYVVWRGGSWGGSPSALRAAYRGAISPAVRSEYGGFRCARTP